MSALDQAFIKAYRKETDHWVTAVPLAQRMPMPNAPLNMPVGLDAAHGYIPAPHAQFVALPQAGGYIAAPYLTAQPTMPMGARPSGAVPMPVQYYFGQPHFPQATPVPGWHVAQPMQAPPGYAQQAASTSAPAMPRAPFAAPFPLNTQPTAIPAAVASASPTKFETKEIVAPRPTITLQPAFEVALFQWPALVEQWLARASSSLNRCAADLARRNYQQRKVMLVTGCRRGSGVSHVTLCMARVAASTGLRVALVDLHFRRPQLADLLQIDVQTAWDDVLSGDQPLGEALIDSPAERVTLLPLTGRSAPNIEQGLAGETFRTLRDAYDMVLVDVGALDTDAMAIGLASLLGGSNADDALVVRDVGETSTESIEAVGRRLQLAGIGHWDLADNFVPKK